MRWESPLAGKDALTPMRLQRRFLWLPETDGSEWRWLERVTVREELYSSQAGRWWEVIEFIDDVESSE